MDSFLVNYAPYIADAVCVLLLVLVAWGFAKKGLYECLMPFIVLILALSLGIYGSRVLTKPITENYVFPKVEEKVRERYESALADSGAAEDLGGIEGEDLRSIDISSLGEGLDEIKQSIGELADKYGIDIKGLDLDELLKPAEGSSGSQAPMNAQDLKDRLLEGLIDKAYGVTSTIVHWVLFAVLTVIGLLVFNLLKRLVGLITKLPIISFFNAAGGILIGAAVFTVVIFIGSRLLRRFGVDFLDRWSQGTVVLNYFMSL